MITLNLKTKLKHFKSDEIPLDLNILLGTGGEDAGAENIEPVLVKSDELPLSFNTEIEEKDSAQLPLPFTRLLHHLDDGITPEPEPEPEPQPKSNKIASCLANSYQSGVDIGVCTNNQTAVRDVSQTTDIYYQNIISAISCTPITYAKFLDLINCQNSDISVSKKIANCNNNIVTANEQLRNCTTYKYTPARDLKNCFSITYFATRYLRNCASSAYQSRREYISCVPVNYAHAKAVPFCRNTGYQPARKPPCEYYPIPIDDTKPDKPRPCVRYPSHRLRIEFTRKRGKHSSSMLPLPFGCKFEIPGELDIPLLPGYIMHNDITAEVNGTPINILSASFTTDVNSYCWQGNVTLYPEDFIKIDMDNRARGNESVIKVIINGEPFIFLAEDYSDNRVFGKKTYTVTGRSQTTHLSKDYAKTKNGLINSDLYARQLADEQLEFLDIAIKEWFIPDWLVPASSYAISDKTPIDVLIDIAQCSGGFVESDPFTRELSFKPKWKVPAWQVKDSAPDMVIPESIIISINGQKRVSTLCNGVYVSADHEKGKGADVYRVGTDKEPRASLLTHPLYTDMPVLESAGIAALSNTGKHKTETVTTPISDKYNIHRAKLGDIVQINETVGHWKGVVTDIALNVSIENDAPVVNQTFTLDRYMDI